MSEIFVPGISSRFNTPQMVEDLMRLERVPRDRAANNIERGEVERGFWQDISRRASALQESARHLFAFQNPFSDRVVRSSDDSVITGTATRNAIEQDRSFTVRQIAQADRFLSAPQEPDFRVEAGVFTFTVGEEEISLDFRGGTMREFVDALNRRGGDMIQASLIAVRPGTNSLIIESRVTGAENRLGFSGAAIALGVEIGMIAPDESVDNPTGFRPLNAVSTAQDAILMMEGIEISRPTNEINDLLPGVTLNIRETSDRPIRLQIAPDREAIKDAIIAFVGNYNRLMAEINILTRNDPRVVDELTFLTMDEREDALDRLGAFAGNTTLLNMRNSLMRIVSSPFETSDENNLALLAQIGISTDPRRAGSGIGGADPSRLRGYLDIDERVLDMALDTRLPGIRQLFGNDTTGDLLVNTGVAFAIDSLTRAHTDRSGIFAQQTNNIDSRIAAERQRVTTLDRQLASREADLRRQFSQMEGAFNRMEQMSQSLDNFQLQNRNNFR